MNLLAVFAKHWTPGKVKTRLAVQLGEQVASRLYLAFLRSTLRRFQSAADQRWLVFTPTSSRAEFETLAGSSWQLVEQSCGDLGQRMAQLFTQAWSHGANRVVLIGSDTPTLPAAHVSTAFEELSRVRAVLGPAKDGGYYLIGLRDCLPPVFNDIAWSTSQVWRQTVDGLRAADVAFETLPTWYDIDTPADLDRLRGELASSPGDDALRQEMETILAGRSIHEVRDSEGALTSGAASD